MALPELLRALERDAEQEISDLRAECTRRVREIRDRTDAELAELTERSTSAQIEQERLQLERKKHQAHRAARAVVLKARARFIERSLDAVRRALSEEAASNWATEAVRERLLEALGYIGSGKPRVRVNRLFADLVRELAAERGLDLELVIDPAVGNGLIVEEQDGSLRIDATFDTRLQRKKNALAPEILKMGRDG